MSLTRQTLEDILAALPDKAIGVLGDLFLDRYLDIDAALTEPSIETGLDAYQVTAVRGYPGAAGTVINNLAALGVGRIHPISAIGDDGEGYELRAALGRLAGVAGTAVLSSPHRRTPTYTKPMLCRRGETARELNRLDIKNRTPLPAELESGILVALEELWESLDVLLVVDQVSEADCGVVTERIREQLTHLGRRWPDRIILADSRARIGLFQSVWLKPNQAECLAAVAGVTDVEACAVELARRCGSPVFCTRSERGIFLADPRHPPRTASIEAVSVSGPIDPVGAGDSTSAGLASALAAGASLDDAARFGNLVASITIRQLGTTGTASPQQLRQALE